MEHEAKGLGIVIRTENARESDRVCTIFSPSLGLIRAMSYGARKSVKSIKAPLYTEGTFSLEKNSIGWLSAGSSMTSDLYGSIPIISYASICPS